MNGHLKISFADDMPAAVVEIVTPDLESVGRVWMNPGGSSESDVPSKDCILCVHLPTGQTIALRDPGNMNRVIHFADLASRVAPESLGRKPKTSRSQLKDPHRLQRHRMSAAKIALSHRSEQVFSPILSDEIHLRLTSESGDSESGSSAPSMDETVFSPVYSNEVHELEVVTPPARLVVRLPGMIRKLHVCHDKLNANQHTIRVYVATHNQIADSAMAYMTRGNLYNAATLLSWAEHAQDMILTDPFSAMAGAYLLLKLHRSDLLKPAIRDLAERWDNVADGSVIWAWRQIHTQGNLSEIKEYLRKAASAGLPVFHEGLRLLLDGLRLAEPKAIELISAISKVSGIVLRGSPFTACIREVLHVPQWHVEFSINYSARDFLTADNHARPDNHTASSHVRMTRMIITGFKCFARRAEITFAEGVTVVIGPNGSGKSSVLDAIRWVFGEQNAEGKKAQQDEGVIFSGSAELKPMGAAQVSLTLDNRSQHIHVNSSEVSITRRIYRFGREEYLMNKVPCRLEDIHRAISRSGPLFCLVDQNRIEAVIRSTPCEVRTMIDESIGLTRPGRQDDLFKIGRAFSEIFPIIRGGGSASLSFLEEDNLLESSVTVMVQPPGKRMRCISSFSNNEKMVAACSLLLAINSCRPAGVLMLDEIDSIMTDVHARDLVGYLRDHAEGQLIITTQNKQLLALADEICAVTMPSTGVSELIRLEMGTRYVAQESSGDVG